MNNLKEGDTVDVDWQLNVEGSRYKDGVNWKNKKVVGFKTILNRQYVYLEGHPYCPVRVERVSLATSHS